MFSGLIDYANGILVLLKKELKNYFLHAQIYVIASFFIALSGWLFFNYLIALKEPTSSTIMTGVLTPLFGNINFLFMLLAPLLTMRLVAEEKKLSTLQVLLLSRLSQTQIILSKFLGSLVASLFLLSLTLIFPIFISFFGTVDWGLVFVGYFGLILGLSFYLAVGLFTSCLTSNQLIAALMSFCFLFALMLLVVTANATNNFIVTQILQYTSMTFHLEPFVKGELRSYSLVYFLSFTGYLLYLAKSALGASKW